MQEDQSSTLIRLELDLLLLFYNFSDQYGNVDIEMAAKWAKEKLGIILPNDPFTLTQVHFDILMDAGRIPDTRNIILNARASKR